MEHDEEEEDLETEVIVVEHEEDKEETEETPIIIVEHEEDKEKDTKELSKEQVEPEPKTSQLSTGEVVKVDKDLIYPTEKPVTSEKKRIDIEPPESTEQEPKKPEDTAKKETEETPIIIVEHEEDKEKDTEKPTKKKVETEPKHPIKPVKKEKTEELKPEEQLKYTDLVLVPLFTSLIIIYLIIPQFPKTPLTILIVNSLLFLLAGYSLVIAAYPKNVNTKKIITGILIGILLILVYQIALNLNYITFLIRIHQHLAINLYPHLLFNHLLPQSKSPRKKTTITKRFPKTQHRTPH